MALRFDKKRPVAEAVPHLARAQAKKALRSLEETPDLRQRVHEARTTVKKLRGLLRLVKAGLGDTYRKENQALRKLGRRLAPLREAEVLLDTFDALPRSSKLAPVLDRTRPLLAEHALGLAGGVDVSDALHATRDDFEKVRARARRWRPKHAKRDDGWRAIESGVDATYRAAREAYAAAYGNEAPRSAAKARAAKARPAAKTRPAAQASRAEIAERFHDLRKAVKYHGHQLKLFADVAPELVEPRLAANDELGDLLGQDHDLAVLAETLEALAASPANARDAGVLVREIDRLEQRLRAKARPLARRLFSEGSERFVSRLHGAWLAFWENGGARARPKVAPGDGPQ